MYLGSQNSGHDGTAGGVLMHLCLCVKSCRPSCMMGNNLHEWRRFSVFLMSLSRAASVSVNSSFPPTSLTVTIFNAAAFSLFPQIDHWSYLEHWSSAVPLSCVFVSQVCSVPVLCWLFFTEKSSVVYVLCSTFLITLVQLSFISF